MAASTKSRLAQRVLIKLDGLLKSNRKPEPADRWWRVEDFAEPPEGGFAWWTRRP